MAHLKNRLKKMYTDKHARIKAKTVTNKLYAWTTLIVLSSSRGVPFLRPSTCQDDKMINRVFFFQDQRSQFSLIVPSDRPGFLDRSCCSSVTFISFMFDLNHRGFFPSPFPSPHTERSDESASKANIKSRLFFLFFHIQAVGKVKPRVERR